MAVPPRPGGGEPGDYPAAWWGFWSPLLIDGLMGLRLINGFNGIHNIIDPPYTQGIPYPN